MAYKTEWANCSALYQIYPRSFKDSDGDGIGDIKGIIEKLDYLKGEPDSLGVDALWLSPFFASPMADFGYDVSDYKKIDPLFGTMSDFDRLLKKAHALNIRVLLDFVLNHTSDRHKWFEESCRSRDSLKRDWYVWRDPKPDGSPPNNWVSAFDGSAWEFDAATGQYYLHTFLKEQPDLNWENPEVREAMKDILRFWFDKGIDGFRMDAVHWIAKDHKLRDDPVNPHYNPVTQPPYHSVVHVHSRRQPKLFQYLREVAEVAQSYGKTLLITEAYPDVKPQPEDYSDYTDFYRQVDASVLVPFYFEPIKLPWDAAAFQAAIDEYQSQLRDYEMPIYVFSNHDSPRIVARYGLKAARAVAVMSFALPGLPMMYYGDELGLDNVPIPSAYHHDPLAWAVGDPVRRESRDPERTPMPWTASAFAGFSKVKSWLPIGTTNHHRNVASQQRDPHSILRLYRRLITLRRESDVLRLGTYEALETNNTQILAFLRQYKGKRLAIMINFSSLKRHTPPLTGEVLLSTHNPRSPSSKLFPYEARVIVIEK